MSLADMNWKRVTIHEVVVEFLRAERGKFVGLVSLNGMQLVDFPDTNDPNENHTRLRYLYAIRAQLIGEIPPDTRWYEVKSLTDEHLSELHVIARCGWDDRGDKNEVIRVASRKNLSLTHQPFEWKRPILWGHQRAGPFTIIEGNNRLTAYASEHQRSRLSIPVLVGLSPTPCFFHIFDPPRKLANDLWAKWNPSDVLRTTT